MIYTLRQFATVYIHLQCKTASSSRSNYNCMTIDIFSPELYSPTRQPIGEAETLPPHCYTSQKFFKAELNSIFLSAWHFVGREDELTEPGNYLVVDTPVGSALVCRSTNNKIRGFVNACRHRGTRLKSGTGRCKTFVCPYHAWSYSLEGKLLGIPEPETFDGLQADQFNLEPIRLACWGGFIFVNHDANAPDLKSWLGNLPNFMSAHKPGETICTKRFEFSVQANWKFLIENALEAYHTGVVHASTLGAQNSESVITKGNWDVLYVLSNEQKSIATMPGQQQHFPFISDLNEKSRNGTWFTVIYPCTQIVFSQDCLWWLDIKPRCVDRTDITLGACFPKSTIALKDFHHRVKPYYERWLKATPEDNGIAEAQQLGHASGLKKSGRFSSREHCIHKLNNWVLDQVLGQRI